MGEKSNNQNNQDIVLTCPICGKSYSSIHEYAVHMNEHSQKEKQKEAEAVKFEKENQRHEDIKRLNVLHKKIQDAKEEYNKAVKEYEEKYDGLIFPWYYKSILQDIPFIRIF